MELTKLENLRAMNTEICAIKKRREDLNYLIMRGQKKTDELFEVSALMQEKIVKREREILEVYDWLDTLLPHERSVIALRFV